MLAAILKSMEQPPDFFDAAFYGSDTNLYPTSLRTELPGNEHDAPPFPPRKRPVFELFDDGEDIDELSTWSDLVSWPSHPEEDDVATELLSVPSFDNVVLSRATSLDNVISHASASSLGRAVPNASATKAFRIPDGAKAMLDSWFGVNVNDPYLKPGDAAALAHLTGLSEQQVKTYMANRRVRTLGGGKSRTHRTER